MRRFIALTATAAVALSLAPFGVARAQDQQPQQEEALQVSLTKPAAGSYAGSVDVAAEVKISQFSPDSIKSVVVKLVPASGSGEYGTFCTQSYRQPSVADSVDPTRSVSISFNWNSARIPGAAPGPGSCTGSMPSSGSLSTNNKYRIQVTATTWGVPGPEQAHTKTVNSGEVKVSNEPTKPSGVSLSYSQSNDSITVEWKKNSEPDVDAYRIEECVVAKSSKPCESGDWKPLADNHKQTNASVKSAGPGIYRYRVAALRPNADGGTMVSDWATAQGDPTEIEVKEKPTPTTQPQVAGETTETTQPQPRTIVRPTRRVQRAAPQVVQRIVEEEPGYNTELPYGDEEAIAGLPIDEAGEGEGQRAILIPLAGGALLLVFAMQVHYLNRRANSALETVAPADGDFGWDD